MLAEYEIKIPAPLTSTEYRNFCDLAYQRCGLHIKEGKEQLVSSRLMKVMREAGIESFEDYYRAVVTDTTGKRIQGFIDALSTNHTSFFRESAHFDFFLEKILPALKDRSEIAVWSAACSSGEEPYTIAFVILEALGEEALPRINLLGTDISTRVLARARKGLFENDRISGVPQNVLRRYFLKGGGKWSEWVMVKKAIRDQVRFERVNLVEELPHVGEFPLIFCRNVMIYFDAKTQERVVRSLSRCLEPGGYLFIGHSESLSAVSHQLQFVAPAIYRKPGRLSRKGAR